MSATPTSLDTVLKLYTTVQQVPPDHRGGYELATETLTTDSHATDLGEAYTEAKDAAARLLPEGWRIIAFRVDR